MGLLDNQIQTSEVHRTSTKSPWSAGVMVMGILAVVIAGVSFAPRVAATVDALTGRAGVRDVVEGGIPSYAGDRLFVDLDGVTVGPQQTLQGYLLSEEGGFFCGDLPVSNGSIDHTVDAPGRNLIGLYDQFQIMQQTTRFDVSLPPTALHHLRQITSNAGDTPEGKGYALGMAEQAELVDIHANLAKASLNANRLTDAKVHIEHVLNILYGKFDPNYGDQDGDTVIEDPGDGLGVLFYASQADTVLGVVANATDVTPYMSERVTAAQTAIGNYWNNGATNWSTQLIAAANSILNSSTVAEAQTFTAQLLGFSNRIAFGSDLDDDGVEPIAGEGGALTVFLTAQEAGDYFPTTGSGRIGVRRSGSAPANDKLVIDLSGITPPSPNNQLWGYLVDDNGDHLPLGALTVNGNNATLEKSLPNRDLIARYNRFYLTEGKLYAADQLPVNALSVLRQATSGATDTPNGKGYAAGLAEQAFLVDTHAKLAQSALAANNLTVGKQHIEHVLNILYGKGNPNYGDQDGDTIIEDPGDGFGVLFYAEKSEGVLGQVTTITDVSPHMAERSTAAQTTIANFWSSGSGTTWSTQLIAAAESILTSPTVADAQGFVPQLLGFSNRLAYGSDLDDDGVEPILGEGGALTVYRTAQEAADYFPEPVATPTPTSTPTVTPTSTTATTVTPTATATSSTAGDSFENDNSCQNAKSIPTNGTFQTRTFHVEGDTDWVSFSAQANRTYVIKIENLSAKSDAVIFVYDVCGAPPDDSQDNAFGSTVTLEWDSTKNGQYFIELRQFDPSQFGNDVNYRISVTQDMTPPATPKNPRCVAVNATTQAIQWERSPERDVVGYRLSYTLRNGGDSGIRTIEGAATSFYELQNLSTNATYDVELRAVDFSGNLSDPTAPALPCTVVAPADNTLPSATVQQPTAGTVFTTTASMLTVTGLAQDNGGNLSRVNVRNLNNAQEGWDFTLAGSSAPFRVEDIPLAAGANQVRVTVFDEANNATPKTITVNRLSGQGGAAIIIAGHNETFGLQTNIYNSTNRAYRIFKSGGFSDEDIYYIAPVPQDADNDGTPDTDALSTPAEFEEAITVWAKDKVGPGKPLFIYMMDHGLENKFCVNGCGAGKIVTPDDLDGWLRTLETDTGVTEVTVIYEACVSGSFVTKEGALGTISKPNRVIITSTGANNNAYASAQGAYFSDAFFSCVADSGNMRACFNEAKDAVLATGVNQTPFLDDNGDGVYNSNDGTIAQNRAITRFFSSVRPVILSTDLQIDGTNGTLSATIEEGAEAVELVWAAVFPPDFTEPTDVTLNLSVPVVRLEPVTGQPGRFSVVYPNGFTQQGDYRVVFYAQDRLGINAAPAGPGTGAQIFLPMVAR